MSAPAGPAGATPPAPLPKPVPRPMGLNAEFYEHCRAGELRIQRCGACGVWRHPPRVRCAPCGSDRWAWEATAGRGAVYTWTVVHQASHPGFAGDVPYAVVVVELEEGVRLVSGLRGADLAGLAIGLPVTVGFEESADGSIVLPVFRPAG